MNKKPITGGIILLFLLSSLIPLVSSDSPTLNKIIYVDDDNTEGPWDGTQEHPYQYIQDGITAANERDTVFVYSGIYGVNTIRYPVYYLKIYKLINLIGENKSNTIIDVDYRTIAIIIKCDCVNVSGFTITNNYCGIQLEDSSNNTITNNIITKNFDGIKLISSSDNVIANNILEYNEINLFDSSGNIIRNNIINKTTGMGSIRLDHSLDTRVINNSITGSIRLSDSANSTIIHNSISRGIIISASNSKYWDNLTIRNNTAEGKSIRYYKNSNNIEVPCDTAQVILFNCTNIIIQNLTLTGVYSSIQLTYSSNNIILNNTAEDVNLYFSSHNIIRMNTIIGNYGANINLYFSSHNIIQMNILTGNFYGIQLEDSSNNTITNNIINKNEWTGIRLLGSKNNTIAANTIEDNGIGIQVGGGSSNIIINNVMTDSIMVQSSLNNLIQNNSINNDEIGKVGISLSSSSNNTVIDNNVNVSSSGIIVSGSDIVYWISHTMHNNTASGKPIRYYKNTNNITVTSDIAQVIIANCTNIIIQNLSLPNMVEGVQLGHSSYSRIKNNTGLKIRLECSSNISIINNTGIGAILDGLSHNIVIRNNSITNNNGGIVTDYLSHNISILNNIITDNQCGISLGGSSHTIKNNTIKNNTNKGISMSGSFHDIVNNFIADNEFGIYLGDYSNENKLQGNEITKNTKGIVIGHHSKIKQPRFSNISNNKITLNGIGIQLVDSHYSLIVDNNFLENDRDAFFESSYFTFWNHNYWGSHRLLPKPIFGTIGYPFISIPWVQFDRHPAKEPYDIGGNNT